MISVRLRSPGERRRPHFVWLAWVCLALVPASLQAQETREAQLLAMRQEKAQRLRPYEPGKIEGGLIALEEGGYLPRLFTPRDGFFPRIGGITPGSGGAAGPGYRRFGLFDGRADLLASAMYSYKRYWIVEGSLTFAQLAGGRAFAEVYAARSDFPEEDFFGPGPDSSLATRTSFDLRNTRVNGAGGVRPVPWLAVGERVEYQMPTVRGGADSRRPSIEQVFTDREAPGLLEQPDFFSHETFVTVDYRDPAPNARSGGLYHASYTKFHDRDLERYSFDRWHFELQQFVPAFKGHRVLALRALATLTDADDGNVVPFYLQPTLGGSHMVRAFRSLRFRDRNMLLLQAEYRFQILPFLWGALFYDTGTVAPTREELSLGRGEHDYGFGFRWGGQRGVFLRTEIAYGGSEGSRFLLRFNNAF